MKISIYIYIYIYYSYTDKNQYWDNLRSSIIEYSTAIESNNKSLIIEFLRFLHNEYYGSSDRDDIEKNIFNFDEYLDNSLYTESILPRSIITQKLTIYLNIFSTFKNPEKHFASELLKSLYFHLLSKSEESLQLLSFKCYSTFKDSVVDKYKDFIYGIINEKTFQNGLFDLSMNKEGNDITESERKILIPILIRILYGKLFYRKRYGNDLMQNRQLIALNYLSALTAEELKPFIDLLILPFGREFNTKDAKTVYIYIFIIIVL